MPRKPSTSLALRDMQIIHDVRRNMPRRDVALKYGISEARVSQIVGSSEDLDESVRPWLREGYYGDLARLQEVMDGKGRPITSGKGDHVINGETGEYAYDPAPRVDAIRTAAQIRKNLALLLAAEKPLPKNPDASPDLISYMEQTQDVWRDNATLREQVADLEAHILSLQARLAAVEGSYPADVVDH